MKNDRLQYIARGLIDNTLDDEAITSILKEATADEIGRLAMLGRLISELAREAIDEAKLPPQQPAPPADLTDTHQRATALGLTVVTGRTRSDVPNPCSEIPLPGLEMTPETFGMMCQAFGINPPGSDPGDHVHQDDFTIGRDPGDENDFTGGC